MEVVTIITSEIEVISMFDTFIYSFPMLHFTKRDQDTAFFESALNNRDKIYYHFILNDTEKELSFNYKEEEVILIKEKFGERPFFMLDLSYTTESLLKEIFEAFKSYLTHKDMSLLRSILISHPFDGIKNFEINY